MFIGENSIHEIVYSQLNHGNFWGEKNLSRGKSLIFMHDTIIFMYGNIVIKFAHEMIMPNSFLARYISYGRSWQAARSKSMFQC